jgi:hypothetical protein
MHDVSDLAEVAAGVNEVAGVNDELELAGGTGETGDTGAAGVTGVNWSQLE